MDRNRLWTRGALVIAAAVLGGCAVGDGAATWNDQPSKEGVAFAERTSELVKSTALAALQHELAETTPGNVAEGKQSIGLIFDDRNEAMRLVGTLSPLAPNDYPKDDFEKKALEQAMQGHEHRTVQRDRGRWYLRRSIPLTTRSQCATCHPGYATLPEKAPVGALMLRVPITRY